MRKILFILFGFCFMVSCKKENSSNLRNKFSGKWEYTTYSGYPFNSPSYALGNGRIIKLNTDGSFERYSHDTLIFKGRYFLQEKADCSQNGKQVSFRADDPSFAEEKKVRIQGDSLFLGNSSCYVDGGDAIYKKIQ